MRHPFIARDMNRMFAERRADPLSGDLVAHAEAAIGGLHVPYANKLSRHTADQNTM
jgi:hypothetical protein